MDPGIHPFSVSAYMRIGRLASVFTGYMQQPWGRHIGGPHGGLHAYPPIRLVRVFACEAQSCDWSGACIAHVAPYRSIHLPVQFSAAIPGIVYALLGTSRQLNVALLQTYGANAWRLHNYLLEADVKVVDNAVEHLKEQTTEVNRERKNYQVRF